MLNALSHSYEEVRAIAIDVLLARQIGQFNEFLEDIGRTLLQRQGAWPLPVRLTGVAYPGMGTLLHPNDVSLVQEIFWDFFRQGAITLGRDANLPGWPGYRLTRFGHQITQSTPFRFHDTNTYIKMGSRPMCQMFQSRPSLISKKRLRHFTPIAFLAAQLCWALPPRQNFCVW